MHVSELDTFIDKFKQLWYCGLDAHLKLDKHGLVFTFELELNLDHLTSILIMNRRRLVMLALPNIDAVNAERLQEKLLLKF